MFFTTHVSSAWDAKRMKHTHTHKHITNTHANKQPHTNNHPQTKNIQHTNGTHTNTHTWENVMRTIKRTRKPQHARKDIKTAAFEKNPNMLTHEKGQQNALTQKARPPP